MSPWRIYYVLAIIEYINRKGSPCLVDDIVSDYADHGLNVHGSLLSDSSLLNDALNVLSLSNIINVEDDNLAPKIIESKFEFEKNLALFTADERRIIGLYYKAAARSRYWLQSALRNLIIRRQENKNSGKSIDSIDMSIPASDRFVQLDDNSPSYDDALKQLEELVKAVGEIRINDWPEKEGVVTNLRTAIEMIKAKYVNETALKTAAYTSIGFILLKFAEAPIVDLANKTWGAILALFQKS